MKRFLLFSVCLLLAAMSHAQTAIPDPNFEDYLIEKGFDTAPRNGEVLTSAISGIIDLDISNQGINDLTGLEAFTSLEILDVSGNNLDELRLSNLSLTSITANNCNLAGKPVRFENVPASSFLTNVNSLSLSDNGLTGNASGVIGFGGVPNVKFLTIGGNNFGTVNLQNTTNIELLDANNCPNLSALNNLDLLTNLKGLILSNSAFNTLSVTSNLQLEALIIFNNTISVIDVKQNPALSIFRGSNNTFNSLDFSLNPVLTSIEVSSNASLSELNVANNNNSSITNFDATDTALSCIQVDNVTQAESAVGWQKDSGTIYSANCNAQNNLVQVSVTSGQNTDSNGNYILTGINGNNNIQLGFDVKDENGNQISNGNLPNYNLIINTVQNTNENPATKGVDFDDFTNKQIQINTVDDGLDNTNVTDDNKVFALGDTLFEADEFFFIDVSSNDPNITLKDAENGVVRIKVKIIDGEKTDIALEVIQNGAEPDQKAILRINSTFNGIPRINNTGAPMPFTIALGDGDATLGVDYDNVPNPIEIEDGASFKEFDIDIFNNDDGPEVEEDFFATISYSGDLPSERVLLPGEPTRVTITDDGDVDTTSFSVSASITGAGSTPNYIIIEGNTFELNFDTGTTGSNGSTYNPVITITKEGVETTEDFTIANLDQSFTISASNPDGSISFLAKDDGVPEGDETYVITIASEDSNLYTITTPISFEVTVKDKNVNTGGSFGITTSLTGAGNGPYYEVEEGNSFSLDIDANNGATADGTYELEVTYETYTIGDSEGDELDFEFIPNFRAVQEKGDVTLQNESTQNRYSFVVDANEIDGKLNFNIVDDLFNERTEELVISVTALQNNIQVTSTSFVVKLKASDPIAIEASLEGAGGPNGYSIQEGETFSIIANIVGTTDLFFPIEIDYEKSSATKGDFAGENIDFVIGDGDSGIYNRPGGDDFTLPIEIYLDDQSGEQESIVIRLPKPRDSFYWSNADANGEIEFTIPIQEREFIATAEINNAVLGNNGIYQIEEGQNFEVEINALGLASDLLFNLSSIQISTEGGSAEIGSDFDASLELYFNEISEVIQFQTAIDGVPESDEIIQITLPKPKGGFTWQNANADGTFSFIIKLLDRAFTEPKNDVDINLSAVTFIGPAPDNFETRSLEPEDGVYKIWDNEELYLNFERVNSNGEIKRKGIKVTTVDGTAIFGDDYYTYLYETINKSELFMDGLSKTIIFDNFSVNEANKTFGLKIEPTTDNYNFLGPNNEVIEYLESLNLAFEIESSGSRGGETQIITTNITGAQQNLANQDAIVKEYLTKESDTIQISLNALKPNMNQDAKYDMEFVIDDGSTLSPEDYILKIQDSNGNDMQGNLSNYTIDNTKDFDAQITLILIDDGVPETQEQLSFTLIPDVQFDGLGSENPGGTRFADAIGGDQLAYRVLVDQTKASEAVYLRLSNTGGVEGATEPEIITCSLITEDNEPYTGHNGPIEIPFEIIDFESINLSISEEEYILSANSFKFNPGESEATIEVTYLNEVDENNKPDPNDIDCDYYYIRLKQPMASAGTNIVLNSEDYLVKIADKSEFLVFVDLDLANVQPVVRNRNPNDDYNDGSVERDCRECIDSYLVEEGSTLKFTMDAAKPVVEGNNYIVNLKIDGSKPFDPATDIDVLNLGDELKREITVKQNKIDREIEIDIKQDGIKELDGETFTITFNDNNDKRYRFSKRDARSYNNSFEIKIIDAIPAKAEKSTTYSTLKEQDSEINYGIITITLDEPAKDEPFFVKFNLLGKAEYGPEKDYIIDTENSLQIDGTSGGVYFNKGDKTVELKFIANDDLFDETTEDIRLELVDAFGYSLAASQSAVLTIEDNDTSDLNATLSPEAITLYEDRDEVYERNIEIKLDKANDTEKNLKINLQLNFDNPDVLFNEDFKIYEQLEGGDLRPIQNLDALYVTIPISKDLATLKIESLTDNADDEGNEKIELTISEGENYAPSEPKTATIIIVDDSENPTNNIDQITAKVTSSACEGENRGEITITNPTQYNYTVLLYKDESEVDSKQLKAFQTDEKVSLFVGLAPGKYQIYLDYNLSTEEIMPILNPPSFSLEVRTSDETILLSSQVINLKTGKIVVSGSTKYTIINNGIEHVFNTENVTPVKLEIPLSNGTNDMTIKGDSECQSFLKTTLFVDNVGSYPNPTQDLIHLAGFSKNAIVQVMLASASGKVVIQNNFIVKSEVLTLDLTGFAPGLYVGSVILEDGTTLPIKIMKK